jgi:S-adenosylmethionine:tRNA ribosyltransferase-isomerase
MKLSDFDYALPKQLIAQYPAKKRDSSRLLVLNRNSGKISHRIFGDSVDYFKKGDLLVLNDTQVLPARLIGKKNTGGKVDCLLLEKKSDREFCALLRPTDIKPGTQINFNGAKIKATVIDKRTLRFNTADINKIYGKGVMPLPPYIKRMPENFDSKRYQTVYAKNPGAIASPTAGLHFTKGLLKKIKAKGVGIAFLTLHVNYATFNPVKEEEITRHKMYKEKFSIDKSTLEAIKNAKQTGNKVIAVGTTSARVLEAIANLPTTYAGYTDLFIYPGYKFKIVDCLLTNFHLPRTTLLMLVSALAGVDNLRQAYHQAIAEKYRFYSYGDAMLII